MNGMRMPESDVSLLKMGKALPEPELDLILGRVTAWKEFCGGRLLVTGGSGFIGSWVLSALLHADRKMGLGIRVAVLTRDPGRFKAARPWLAENPAVEIISGDVRDFSAEGGFSHVFHGAASPDAATNGQDPLLAADTIVSGTRRVLDIAAASGCRRMIFISSGAVYGPQPPDAGPLREESPFAPDPLGPGSAYGEGKRMAECLCGIYGRTRGLEIAIARCFAFAGPLLPTGGGFAVGNFIKDALAGRAITISGDGRPVRSYLYAADLAAWLLEIWLRGKSLRPYNVGSDRPVTILELAERVAENFSPRPEIKLLGRPEATSTGYVPDVSRARAELGLDVWTPLEEGIRRTAAWNAVAGKERLR